MSDAFDETVGDALTTVRLVPRWTLASEHWDGVADALKDLDAAIRSGSGKLVQRASENLDSLYPPTRLSAIPHGQASTPHRVPPPPDVMELVNALVHPSGGWSAEAGQTTDPRSGF
jgi:hypothetical protein